MAKTIIVFLLAVQSWAGDRLYLDETLNGVQPAKTDPVGFIVLLVAIMTLFWAFSYFYDKLTKTPVEEVE